MPEWAGDARTDYVEKKAEDKFLAFDIETAKITVEGIDLLAQRPLGISCAATVATGDSPMVWQGGKEQMTALQCRRLVQFLETMDKEGYTIVTFNGCGFDFNILAEESGAWETCRKLALGHIDVAFAFFCEKGFMVSLQSICKGMGLEGKSGHGSDAPRLWAEGKRQQVLDYVAQDVKVTMNVFRAIRKRGGEIRWISKSDKLCSWHLNSGRLLTVREAMGLPLPDTSWMKKTCLACGSRRLGDELRCQNRVDMGRQICGCEEFEGGAWPRSKFTSWLTNSV